MKTCFKCRKTKSMDDFYRHPQMADGRLGKCKECAKQDAKIAWALTEPNEMRKRKRTYREKNRALVNEYFKAWAKLNKERVAISARRYERAHADRKRAHRAVAWAIKIGDLTRPEVCSACGRVGKPHAHHDDYSKPLEVHWLCSLCHGLQHRVIEP